MIEARGVTNKLPDWACGYSYCVEVDSLVLRSLVSIVSLDEDPGSPGSDIMFVRR